MEILGLIALVGLLAIIAPPVFTHLREQARQTTCLSHQRQLALALVAYAQDHEKILPHAATVWSNVKVPPNLLICPTAGTDLPNGYLYNATLSGQPLDETPSLLATWLTVDGKQNEADARHGGKVIASYLDGHVALTTADRCRSRKALRKNPKDGAELVYVPTGTFIMGDVAADAAPVHRVTLSRGFYLYKTEVTVKQYLAFCTATHRYMPSLPATQEWTGWRGHEDYPMTMVNWFDANAYAKWAGAALPTEAQWEFAARGPEGNAWPWGNSWNPKRCVNSAARTRSGPEPVGSYPEGASWCGALDLAGNVWEWCQDWEGTYTAATQTDPVFAQDPGEGVRVLRGGAWSDTAVGLRAQARAHVLPVNRSNISGFRCARNL